MTALHWACYHDETELAERLIDLGANVNARNRYGISPLYLACLNGNESIVKRLLSEGADPNTAINGGESALMTAARTGKIDTVRALIKLEPIWMPRNAKGKRQSCGHPMKGTWLSLSFIGIRGGL